VSERYEKLGTSVRLELTSQARNVITLREGGYAEIRANGLKCGPLAPEETLIAPHSSVTTAIDEAVARMSRGLAVVERLTLVEGRAVHRLADGTRRRRWEDSSGRMFVTLVRQPCGRKAALALGAETLDAIDPAPVSTICEALARPETLAPSHAPAITMEPWVVASLVRAMANERLLPASGLRLTQTPPPGARDGRGGTPRKRIVRQMPSQWPDTFRPSYRFAPVAMPLHVDLTGARDGGPESPFVAVALASSWVARAGSLHARVWIEDREAGRVSFARIVADPGRMTRRTVNADDDPIWFPDGAGAWGRRLTLSRVAAHARSA